MKKLVSIILAVMLVSALAVTSFAATPLPTVDYVFEDGGYTYVFGSTNAVKDEVDAGLTVVDNNGYKHYAKFSELDTEGTEMAKVAASGKFGFELKTNGLVDDEFVVDPTYTYEFDEDSNVTIKGMPYLVNAANKTAKIGTEGTPVAWTKWASVNEWTKTAATGNATVSQKHFRTLLTFDISTLEANADKYYLDLPAYGINGGLYGDQWHDKDYLFTVHGTVDNSDYVMSTKVDGNWTGTTYNNTIGNGSVVVGDAIVELSKKDIFYPGYKVATNTNNYYAGVRVDITDYIKAQKANPDVKNITLYIKPVAGATFTDTVNLYFSGINDITNKPHLTMKIVPVNFAD